MDPTANDEYASLASQVRVLNQDLKAAIASGDTQTQELDRSHIALLIARMRQLAVQANQDDTPSHAMQVLDQVSDAALDTLKFSAKDLAKTLDTLPGILTALPTVLMVGLVAAALIGAAYLFGRPSRATSAAH